MDPNAIAFRHSLSAIERRRTEGELTEDEQDVRAGILAGLIADKGGEQQIGTVERILAEIISSDVSLLVTVNQAIEGVLRNNQKARENPKALTQLDGYKRDLVNSLTGDLHRFGFDRTPKHATKSLAGQDEPWRSRYVEQVPFLYVLNLSKHFVGASC